MSETNMFIPLSNDSPPVLPLSEDSSSLIGSVTTSSTVWGPGALTGKFLKAVGEWTLDFYVSMVIRRRLTTIKRISQKRPHVLRRPSTTSEQEEVNEIRSDLEELCRDYYSFPIRRAAASLIWYITIVIHGRNGGGGNVGSRLHSTHAYESLATNNQWNELLALVRQHEGLLSESQEAAIQNPRRRAKILVLGAGGVGKSTLVEQIKHAFFIRASQTEVETRREIVINNVIASMKNILLVGEGIAASDLSHSTLLMEAKVAIIKVSEHGGSLSPNELRLVGWNISTLWGEPAVRELARTCVSRPSVLHDAAPDSAEYFFNSVDRIFASDYVPTHEDIMRTRVRTTGITQTLFRLKLPSLDCSLIDTGGERSERRKWIHCFDNVTTVLFVVALPDYNKPLYEDAKVNRMDESLNLFQSIVHSRWLTDALFILLFNKVDIFAEELKHSPLKDWMPGYEGQSYDDALKYIESRFMNLLGDKSKPISIKYTCAVDESAMRAVAHSIEGEVQHHAPHPDEI